MAELTGADFTEDVVMVNVHQTYVEGMRPFDLYQVSRGYWKLTLENVEYMQHVLVVFERKVIEVYDVARWYEAGTTMRNPIFVLDDKKDGRVEFVGKPNEDEKFRCKYIGKNAPKFVSAMLVKKNKANN